LLLKWIAAALVATAGCGSSRTPDVPFTPSEDASDGDASDSGSNLEAAIDGETSVETSVETSIDGPRDAPGETSDEILQVLPAQFTISSMPMRMLAEGDGVDLWNAPQGGHVVLFGAKVKNMTSDTANLKVRFRRPSTGLIVAEEGRTVKMVPAPGEPGVLQPDIRSNSQVANVPLCPSLPPDGIVDEWFDVEVLVTALYTQPVQTGTAKIRVVARCSTPSDEVFCRCECGPNYFLGKCNEFPDGGGPRDPGDGGPN
jgi:hypothetical protein